MTTNQAFEYARDDFNYPRFIQRIMKKALNFSIEKVQENKIDSSGLNKFRFGVEGIAILTLIFGLYFWAALFIAIWLFLDQVQLHLFVDRSVASSRFKHFIEEAPLMLGLSIHLWLQGHIWTGIAGLVGISGIYLLTNLQMKYDLNAINLPRLYFLRWDRMGILFLFTLLGSWPGERAYLFVVLLAWFLAALSFYDYIWILIQLAKKKT
ncbi:MAG: hypothetical protein HOD43_00890 [Candidatus Marinimicrobia bacterium]|jgi:hypothetical protein|nr:hypothetical protein [Candidatus Neomarinimicrobiota bacterium]MBT3629836.1 hypothetical protein [Candidatus Neomarinimicrobiota bacterium]MBT3824127.1 hypothetical protein [Candidatus Neomarinimicrobiota bacterium]MBT4129586.1 hypothetical protein [Candidatus Neomarinimicrobiota bacterium]MBT4294343.1 hypothetical protein [Candidatus Neomarinimicrobiota bacterium]